MRLVSWILAGTAVAHGILLSLVAAGEVARVRVQGRRLDVTPAAGSATDFEAAAYRVMRRVAERIPPHDRVLVLTAVPTGIAYQFYFLPRPFTILQDLQPHHLDLARAAKTPLLEDLRLRYAQLEERGLRLTSERLAARLRETDWLVVFFPGVALPDVELEEVATIEHTKLYRVVHK